MLAPLQLLNKALAHALAVVRGAMPLGQSSMAGINGGVIAEREIQYREVVILLPRLVICDCALGWHEGTLYCIALHCCPTWEGLGPNVSIYRRDNSIYTEHE